MHEHTHTNKIHNNVAVLLHLWDINTIRDDVTSLTQLLPVIQRLANNETDEYIITKYSEMIKFMESSISALNNLVSSTQRHTKNIDHTSPHTLD